VGPVQYVLFMDVANMNRASNKMRDVCVFAVLIEEN
jgi:hypothetical protein